MGRQRCWPNPAQPPFHGASCSCSLGSEVSNCPHLPQKQPKPQHRLPGGGAKAPNSPAALGGAPCRCPRHVPNAVSRAHTCITFRSCSSSSIFGAPCALAFSWGSSDSASLSECTSGASVPAAAGEETRGEPRVLPPPRRCLGSTRRCQSQSPLLGKKKA